MRSRQDVMAITVTTLLTLYLLGILNVLLRNSMGVFGPELVAELGVPSAALGGMASAFFFAYALAQIPTGILLDRHGAKVTLGCLMLLTTAGAVLFSVSASSSLLVLARMLMGLGCAGCFTGAFFIFARHLPRESFSFYGGLFNSIAMFGTLLAATPLATATAFWGWRSAALILAGLAATALLLTWLVLRDGPTAAEKAMARQKETFAESIAGLLQVMRIPGTARLVCTGFGMSAAPVITSLWGGPYLHDVQGLDDIGRGNVLLFMASMGVASHFVLGQLSIRLNTLRGVIIGGSSAVILSLTLLAVLHSPPVWLVALLFGTISFGCGYPAIVHAHIRAMVPEKLIGRGITLVTMGVMGVVALMQMLVGIIIAVFPRLPGGLAPEHSYHAAFAFMAVVALLALLLYARIDDSKPALA